MAENNIDNLKKMSERVILNKGREVAQCLNDEIDSGRFQNNNRNYFKLSVIEYTCLWRYIQAIPIFFRPACGEEEPFIKNYRGYEIKIINQ